MNRDPVFWFWGVVLAAGVGLEVFLLCRAIARSRNSRRKR